MTDESIHPFPSELDHSATNQPASAKPDSPSIVWGIPYLLRWLQRQVSDLLSRWHLLRVTQGRGRRWQHALRNFEAGVSGISVTSWASDLAPWLPDFDICIIKTDSMAPIREVLLDIANQLNIPGYPNSPLNFVRTSP